MKLLVVHWTSALILLITATSGRGANTQITLSFNCAGLGYDATTAVFYATARTNIGAFTNCLLRVAPLSGAATVVTNLGSELGTLAVSSEHRALYIALPGQQAVRRFDLAAGTLGPAFSVGGAARQLVVMPGWPERLVVVRKEDSSVSVFENSTALPDSISGAVSLLCSGGDGGRLYGYDPNTTTFYRFQVDETGISVVDGVEGTFPFPGANMRFAGGRLYTGEGWIADPETKTMLGYFGGVGTTGTGAPAPLGHVVPDLARNRVFVLRTEWAESPIFACDPKTFRVINSGVMSNTTWAIRGDEPLLHDFQRWGTDGFACRTHDKLLISRSSLVPTGAARNLAMGIRATTSLVTNQQTFSYEIACTNLGPVSATNAVLQLNLPPETTYVNATTTRGTLNTSSNAVRCTIGRLVVNATASIRVTVRVQTPNSAALLATATFSSPAVDLDESNNFGVLLGTANWKNAEEQLNVVSSIVPTDMAYAAATKKFYLVFGPHSGALAQSVVGLDPVTGAFDRPRFLQRDAQKVAVSADGGWIDIALGQAGQLCRINLATGELTNQVWLSRWQEIQSKTESPKDENGIRFTSDRAVSLADDRQLGTFPAVLFHQHLFVPEVSARRFYQFIYDYPAPDVIPRLRVFDLDTFRLLRDQELLIPPWHFDAFSRWGEAGFLVRSGNGFVVWRSRHVRYGAEADLTVTVSSSPESTTPNGLVTLVAKAENAGPNTATNVLLRLWLPGQTTFVDATASGGVLTRSNALLELFVNRLHGASNAFIRATVQPTNSGVLVSRAHVSSQSRDTHHSNDVAVCSTLVTPVEGWPEANSAITISLPANDLIYEPVSDRLLASLASSAGVHGNSIAVVNPRSGLIDSVRPVGSEPGRLAVSDDGQYLYVSLVGAEAVSRVRLSDWVEEQRFSVGTLFGDGEYASDLAVRPKHPKTVALLRARPNVSPSTSDLLLYEDGQRLPQTLNAFSIQVIGFHESGDTLFGYGNEVSDFLFSVINVKSNGLEVVNDFEGAIGPGFAESFRYEGGLVFGTQGSVFDPMVPLGHGVLPGVGRFGGIAPHTDAGRAYGLTVDGTNAVLRTYELDGMTLTGQQSFPAATDYPGGFQRCGEDRVAYRSASSIVVMRSTLVPTGPKADLQVHFHSVPPGVRLNEAFALRIAVTNAGPNAAENTVVSVALPDGLELLSADCDGGWIEDGVWYACTAGRLEPGAAADWTLSVKSTTSGGKSIRAFVNADVTDFRPGNDAAWCFIPTGAELGEGSRDMLGLPARTLVWSAARKRLYAAIPAGVGWQGNSIIEIDPATGRVRGPLFVGSEPLALAPTDDGNFLYVSMYGLAGMRRIDLNNWSAGPRFQVGNVEAAVALAGSSNGVVATHGSDAVVYVGGTRKSEVHHGLVARLLRGVGTRVYGFHPRAIRMSIVELSATATSIVINREWTDQILGGGVDLCFGGGRLFSGRGDVLDPETQTVLGRFADFQPGAAFCPEASGSRLYTVEGGFLRVWETTNYQAGASASISPEDRVASDLVRWGADGLAFLEDNYPVWVRSPLVRTAPGTDTDGDGMPDGWELANRLNPNLSSDASGDADGDRVSNRDEYVGGTNPQFAEGPLRLSVQEITPAGFHVRFAGQSARSYRIEHTETLSPANWQPLATGLAGNDRMIEVPCPISAARGFLRVVEESTP